MGRRVEHHVRLILGEDLHDPPGVPDGADQNHQVQLRMLALQLLLDLIGVILINIEDNELPGRVVRQLAGDLRTNASAAAGDHQDLSSQVVEDLVHVDLDGVTAQQVLHRHISQGADGHLTADQLIHAGNALDLTASLLADIQDIPPLLHGSAGDGQENLVDAVLLHAGQDIIPVADDGDTVNVPPLLVRIVIDDAADPVGAVLHQVHIPQEHPPRGARSDQHDPSGPALAVHGGAFSPLQQHKAVGKANGQHHHELDDHAKSIVSHRHASKYQRDAHHMEQAGDHGGKNDTG